VRARGAGKIEKKGGQMTAFAPGRQNLEFCRILCGDVLPICIAVLDTC
jgi:hypothetical protein